MKKWIALLPLFLYAAGPALAQAPAAGKSQTSATQSEQAGQTGTPGTRATETIDPAKEAAIRHLMDLTGAGKIAEQMLDAMMPDMRAIISQSLGQNARAEQFLKDFFAKFRTHFNDQDIVNAIVPVYARHFSLEDIQALNQFYETPAGQRVVRELPQVTRESQAAGAALGQKIALQTLSELSNDYPELKEMLQPAPGAPGGPGAAPAPAPQPNPAPTQP